MLARPHRPSIVTCLRLCITSACRGDPLPFPLYTLAGGDGDCAALLRTRFGQVTLSQLEFLHQPFQRHRSRCGRTVEVHHKASVSTAHDGHDVVTMRYLHGEGIVLI